MAEQIVITAWNVRGEFVVLFSGFVRRINEENGI